MAKHALTRDEEDLITALNYSASMGLAQWVREQLEAGHSLDATQAAVERTASIFRPWRIGRGI